MKRMLVFRVLLGFLTLGVGVGVSAGYGSDCGCGPVEPIACGECDPCVDPCAAPCAPPCNPLQVPLKVLDWLVHLGCYYDCDSGCGERYWGECSEPVDYCDPCDPYGNWIGRAGPPVRRGPGGPAVGYAQSARRGPVYAQRPTPAPRPAYAHQPAYVDQPSGNEDAIKAEFGLDPSAQVLSRSDHLLAPAEASPSMAGVSGTRSAASQSARPHRAPPRR